MPEPAFVLIPVSPGCVNPSELFRLLVDQGEPKQKAELKEPEAILNKTPWRKLMLLAILRTWNNSNGFLISGLLKFLIKENIGLTIVINPFLNSEKLSCGGILSLKSKLMLIY